MSKNPSHSHFAARLSLISLFLISIATRIDGAIERVEPPFWWAAMPTQTLQIQLYGKNIGLYRASIDYPGVTLTKQIAVDSPNYLFLYLEIAPDSPKGSMEIVLNGEGKRLVQSYELQSRNPSPQRNGGFDASDVIYLMMPDRFANGDPSNDSIPGMLEGVNRSDPTKRQGGDLQGVAEHLDHIQNLGMTAIWFTPILENDMPPDYGAYHGYAVTDLYKVDRRFGSNKEYRRLVETIHARGMKVIMDMIHNHIGIEHWWMKDLPTADWVHAKERYGQTNFQDDVPADPHASQFDKDQLVKGWFVPEMPDLDQRNELLADYLIQNTLWWIEYSGIDGIRMDTHFYPYPEYMARWTKEVLTAYPSFNIVGEALANTVAHEAFWQYDEPGVDDGYNSHLPSVTDFPLTLAIRSALTQEPNNSNGLLRLYRTLAQDGLYADPLKNVIFLDNHDLTRIYEQLNKDPALFKMAYAFLMTTRGIPQVYYGTELMMGHENRGGDDEAWRQTMPGGWIGDNRSVFTISGRTPQENETIDYVQRISEWRKRSKPVHEGKLIHFIPRDNIYVYFRVLPKQAVMVVMNLNDAVQKLSTRRFDEILHSYTTLLNVVDGREIALPKELEVAAKTTAIFDLK